MEVIKRKFCLEDFISRTNTKWGYEDGSWGKVAYDVAIPDYSPLLDIKDKLPMIYNMNEIMKNGGLIKNQIQFNILLEWYRWINKFINETIFYKKCKRKTNNEEKYIWVETYYDFINNDVVNLYESESSINANDEEIENGTIIGINENAEMFNEIFRSKIFDDGTVLRYEKSLLEMAEYVISGDETYGISKAIPYIELPINLNTSIDSLGSYENYITKWDDKTVYSKGSVVLHYDEDVDEWNCYQLVKGNKIHTIEATGELYNFYERAIKRGRYTTISFSKLNDYEDILIGNDLMELGKPILFVNGSQILYPSIVYESKYDETTGKHMFNTPEVTYWKKVEIDDTVNQNIETTSESHLNSLIRMKKTVSEDGTVLPFIINTKGEMDTELRYNMGYTNHSFTDNDEVYFDSLDKVEIYDVNASQMTEDDVSPYTTIELKKGQIKITNKNGETRNTDSVCISSTLFPEKGEVKFYYRIGGILSNIENASNAVSNGVCYSEYYSFEKKSDFYNVKMPLSVLKKYNTTHELKIVDYEFNYDNDEEIIMEWSDTEMWEDNIGTVYKFKDIMEGILSTDLIEYRYYDNGNPIDCKVKNVEAEFIGKYREIDGINYMEFKIVKGKYTAPEGVDNKKNRLRYIYIINEKWRGVSVIENVKIVLKTHELIKNNACEIDVKDRENVHVQLLSKYNYIDINYEEKRSTFVNEYLSSKEEKVILSNVEYGGVAVSDDNFIYSELYKNPFDIGVEEKEKKIDINIERGTSSFFERYHILSEVNTMQDLENYRNNLFKL